MTYVPGFAYDLFLSYASEDNVNGWVKRFFDEVTRELAQLLGRPFSKGGAYIDEERLKVGQDYPASLDDAARCSAVLVMLLSPSYLTSEWCTRERQKFKERLPGDAEFAECAVAVRLRPTGPLPENLERLQRKDFMVPGSQEPWAANSPRWLEIVHELASEVKLVLQDLRKRAGSVFLGPTLPTQMQLRASFVDYLSEKYFRATPDPLALIDDVAARQKALSEAACAVHFLGSATDLALESLEESIQYCSGPTIVFRPFGVSLTAAEEDVLAGISEERYPRFINGDETELKKFLEDLLFRKKRAQALTSPSLGLVCEPADFAWAAQFHAGLLSVDYPRFLQERLTNVERIRKWRKLVRDSHGLLFYHARSQEQQLERIWRLAQEEESRAVRIWYLDNPDLDDKQKRRPQDPTYPVGLEEFFDKVRRKANEVNTRAAARA